MNLISPETRMMGLPYGEEIMIVGRTVWTQSTSVTDRQTDVRTDGRTELLSQRPCNAERRTVMRKYWPNGQHRDITAYVWPVQQNSLTMNEHSTH